MPLPDHRFQIEIRRRDDRTCVQVADRFETCHDGVAARALVTSQDGSRVAYPALDLGRWHMVSDGVTGPAWDGVASPVFSPDGEHLAYAASDGGAWRVLLDGRSGAAWDSLVEGSLTVAPGGHVAYGAFAGGLAHAVLDDDGGAAFEAVDELRLSPDGRRFAFVGRREERSCLVLDGVPQGWHAAVSGPVFSQDGVRVAWASADSGVWSVMTDRGRSGTWGSVEALAFTADGRTLLGVVRSAAGKAVLVEDSVGPFHASVDPPARSPSGGRWGYIARDRDSCRVVIDGVELRAEGRASSLVFGGDGRRFAYVASREGRAYVVDERGAHAYDLVLEGSLVFTADGTAWACVTGDRRRRKLYVTLEGSGRRRPFDWIEVTRITRHHAAGHAPPTPDEAVREWIAAEAERLRGTPTAEAIPLR